MSKVKSEYEVEESTYYSLPHHTLVPDISEPLKEHSEIQLDTSVDRLRKPDGLV